jgi:hypothetical protein
VRGCNQTGRPAGDTPSTNRCTATLLLRTAWITPWRKNPKVHHRTHNSPPPVPVLSQSTLPSLSLQDPFWSHLPTYAWSSKWSLSFGLSHQNLYTLLSSLIRATFPAHFIRLDLIYLIILWGSSLFDFRHSPVTSSLLGLNMLLRTLFSNTLSLCSSLNVRDQVSQPYKTTGRIMVLYILTFGAGFSSGSIVSDYVLDDRAIGVRSPAEAKNFSSILCVQTGSGAHPASCMVGTGGYFPEGKARSGHDPDHSPHLVPRSGMSRSYTSSPSKSLRGL